MNVEVTVDIGDILDLATTFLDGRKAAEDLTKRLTSTVFRDSQERFATEGPGWEPRKETADEAAQHLSAAIEGARARAVDVVRKKLRREFRRAKKKFSADAAQGRYEILREFERRISGGSTGYSLVNSEQTAELEKKMKGVEKRLVRQTQKQEGKLLRGLAGSNRKRVRGLEGEVRNMVPFSAAQNDGAQVGHGAQLPARTFLGMTPTLDKKLDETAAQWLGHLGADD